MDGTSEATTAVQTSLFQPQAEANLLTLPGELRNHIYRVALVSENVIYVDDLYDGHPHSGQVVFLPYTHRFLMKKTVNLRCLMKENDYLSWNPALLRVSRQIREEAHSIFFEENTFMFSSSSLWRESIAAFERMAGRSSQNIVAVLVNQRTMHGDKLSFQIRETSTGALRILDDKGRRLNTEEPKLGASIDSCCCHVVDAASPYCEPVTKNGDSLPATGQADQAGQSQKGQVMAFMTDYVRRLGRRRGHHDWTTEHKCGQCGKKL